MVEFRKCKFVNDVICLFLNERHVVSDEYETKEMVFIWY